MAESPGSRSSSEMNLLPYLIAFLVILVTLVVYYLQRQKKLRNHIILTGLCNSGKTLIFSQLTHKKFIQTLTSIQPNAENYQIESNVVRLVDIPGHDRIRDRFLEQYKQFTRAILFVIDSSTIQQDVRDAAEFLYNILVDPILMKSEPKVLIVCNKQDQTLAKGAKIIRSILEKELNTLRITKSSQLESVDPKAKKAAILASSDKDFSFEDCYFQVDFVECFACNNKKEQSADLGALDKWLSKEISG